MAESLTNSSQSEPAKCTVCKTFYASPAYDNKCSKCYKETQSELPTEATVSNPVQPPTVPTEPEEVKSTPPVNPGRCYQCNRKLGLMPFTCRCEFSFCTRHRLPVDHACVFDHHAGNKQKLKDSNPEVKPSKFEKI